MNGRADRCGEPVDVHRQRESSEEVGPGAGEEAIRTGVLPGLPLDEPDFRSASRNLRTPSVAAVPASSTASVRRMSCTSSSWSQPASSRAMSGSTPAGTAAKCPAGLLRRRRPSAATPRVTPLASRSTPSGSVSLVSCVICASVGRWRGEGGGRPPAVRPRRSVVAVRADAAERAGAATRARHTAGRFRRCSHRGRLPGAGPPRELFHRHQIDCLVHFFPFFRLLLNGHRSPLPHIREVRGLEDLRCLERTLSTVSQLPQGSDSVNSLTNNCRFCCTRTGR